MTRWSLLLLATTLAGCAASPPAPAPCAVLSVSDSRSDNRLSVMSGTVRAIASGTVHAADALGQRVPGLAAAPIGADGGYRLLGVPGGYTFFLVAEYTGASGKPARRMTIAMSAPEGVTADIDAATTLVATALAARIEGFTPPFDPARYAAAVASTRAALKDEAAIDFADPAAIQAALTALRSTNPTLHQQIASLEAAFSP